MSFWMLLFVFTPFITFAQQPDKKLAVSPDIHFRMFWMSTTYPTDYKNDYALGSSLDLGTKFTYSKHWELRVGYRVFANLWSSELTAADPISGGSNRYEVGLFDVLNPEDKFFGKLENLSLTYTKSNWGVAAGRMAINEDWINAQDGRLSPTGVEGAKAWFATPNKWKFSIWGIEKMSVRGTSKWLNVGESIGVFPVGRDTKGEASQYGRTTQSNWIGIAEVSKNWEGLILKLSNTIAQNISNTLWAKAEKKWENEAANTTWLWGLQAGYQSGIGEGGNLNPMFRYKSPDDRNWAISTRFGYKNSGWDVNLNYTKAGGKGIWLNPREWGKEPYYTFIPRERNEGFSSLDALTAFSEYSFKNSKLKVFAHLGFHWLPSINAPSENKYNLPSYRQLNVGMKYLPTSIPKLALQVLVMNKEALGNSVLKPGLEYNKVGMIHVDGILNWRLN